MHDDDNKSIQSKYRELVTHIYRLNRAKCELQLAIDNINSDIDIYSTELAHIDCLIESTSSIDIVDRSEPNE